MEDAVLVEYLRALPADARRRLRRWLIQDPYIRGELARRVLREGTPGGDLLADLLDTLNMDDAARRQVVRVLGEMEARGGG